MINSQIPIDLHSQFNEREAEVRHKVSYALSLLPMECLAGNWPQEATATLSPTSPQVRRFRATAFATRHMSQDRISKFWFRNYLWASLLRELMTRSLASDPALRVARLSELALRTGLSVASVHDAIDLAVRTGDFTKVRSDIDKRLIFLEPSAQIRKFFDADIDNNVADLSHYCNRASLDSVHLKNIGGPHYARLMIRFVSFPRSRQTSESAVLFRRKFFFFMWDLILNTEGDNPETVTSISKKMGVSVTSIAKVIHEAKQGGWLEPGEQLRPSAMALHRFTMLCSVGEMRANLLLDALTAVLAEPALAPALDPLSN